MFHTLEIQDVAVLHICGLWLDFCPTNGTLPHELTPEEWFAIIARVCYLELQGRDCRQTLFCQPLLPGISSLRLRQIHGERRISRSQRTRLATIEATFYTRLDQ